MPRHRAFGCMRPRAQLLGLAILAASPKAFAQNAAHATTDEVRVSYDVDDGCPSQKDFEHLVAERGVTIPKNETASRGLGVHMHKGDSSSPPWHGSLVLSDPAGAESTKTIAGASCADVARSLAIFTALSLAPIDSATPPATNADAAIPTTARPVSGTSADSENFPWPAPTPLVPADPYLHRNRFDLGAHVFALESLGSGWDKTIGPGISARYFFGERWAVRIDADFLRTVNQPQSPALATEAAARAILSGEFVAQRATGDLVHDNFLAAQDVYLNLGVGVIWTRPLSNVDPAFRSFSYSGNQAFQFGVGARAFVTPFFAISVEPGLLTYNEKYESSAVGSTTAARADPGTWYGDSKLRVGFTGQITLEFFFPGASPPPRK